MQLTRYTRKGRRKGQLVISPKVTWKDKDRTKDVIRDRVETMLINESRGASVYV